MRILLFITLIIGVPQEWAYAQFAQVSSEMEGIHSQDPLQRLRAFHQIQTRNWTAEQTADLSDALANKLKQREDIRASANSVVHLTRDHPRSCQSAVSALEGLCDPIQLRDGGISEGDLCAVLLAMAKLDPALIGVKANIESIAHADQQYPYASAYGSASLAKFFPEESVWLEGLLSRLEVEPSPVLLDALGEIGPSAKVAVPKIEQQLNSESICMKTAAAIAILKIDERDRELLVALLSELIQEPTSDMPLEPFGPSPPAVDHRAYIAGALASHNRPELRQSIARHFEPLSNTNSNQLRQLVDLILKSAHKTDQTSRPPTHEDD